MKGITLMGGAEKADSALDEFFGTPNAAKSPSLRARSGATGAPFSSLNGGS
jgi:hypothetical protein